MKTKTPPTKAQVREARTAATKLVRAGLLVKTGADEYRLPRLEPKMDPHTAVFNQHINAAGARAKQKFIDKFGYEVWKEQLEDAYVDGIMVIFKSKPTEWTQFYVDTVTKFVNEGRF